MVGVAGWPCVRDSIGTAALACASDFSAAAISRRAGNRIADRASASIRPYARLLMSSDVQAKWMNSATPVISGMSAKRSFNQYSTAFTSWLVVRSIALTRAASAGENDSLADSSAVRAAAPNGAISAMRGSSDSATSQAISTRTRARMSPCSLKQPASGATFAA